MTVWASLQQTTLSSVCALHIWDFYVPWILFAADQSRRSLDDPKCMKLAELHSKAVRYTSVSPPKVPSLCVPGGFPEKWHTGELQRNT
jgi:hypothetical protein